MMGIDKRNNLLKLYIFVAIYSNAFRVTFGKWATLLADIMLVTILAYVILANRGKICYKRKLGSIIIPIVMLQFLAVAEIFNSNINNTLYGFIEYRKSVFQILCFFIAFFCANSDKFWENLNYTEWIIFPTILYGIKQAYFYSNSDAVFYGLQDAATDTLQYGGTVRSISIYSGPFHYGMLCSLMLCVAIALLFKTKNKLHIIPIISCLIGAYVSLTRTNLVCCICVIVVFSLNILTKKSTAQSVLRKIIIVFTLCILASWIFFEYANLLANGNSIVQLINSVINFGSDSRFTGRVDTWSIAIDMIQEKPFWGYGIGAAGDTLSLYGVASQFVTPHNMFIKLLVETGIFGCVLMVIILITSYKICVAELHDDIKKAFFFASFSVVILNALVGSTISTFPIMSLFWIFIGMQSSDNREEIKTY